MTVIVEIGSMCTYARLLHTVVDIITKTMTIIVRKYNKYIIGFTQFTISIIVYD